MCEILTFAFRNSSSSSLLSYILDVSIKIVKFCLVQKYSEHCMLFKIAFEQTK